MHRRSFLKASAAAALLPMASPTMASAAQKQQVLRLAMTLSDIPLTTGQATGGAEGFRFIGYSLYDALFQWDLRHRDRTSKLIPALAESYTIDPETKTTWTFRLRKGVKFMTGLNSRPTPSSGISTKYSTERHRNSTQRKMPPVVSSSPI